MNIARENQQLGAYRLLRLLGSGGMGEVWLAEDRRLLRSVAIKILPYDVAGSPEARARLTREAQIAAQLNHPSIATIHSIEEEAGSLLVVMEFVDGKSLSTAIRNRELSDREILRIARDVAEALGEAHEHGIVHRDIKPDNVMISGRRVKVLDFGIAKRLEPEAAAVGEFRTQEGIVVGTIEYMSPEQALGKVVDARSDIFSFGVMLYHALAGVLPFSGTTPTEVLLRICRDEPIPFREVRPDLAGLAGPVIAKCLEKDREKRYSNGNELCGALEEVIARHGSRSSQRRVHSATMRLEEKAAPEPAPEPKPEPKRYPGQRILVADDDASMRSFFTVVAEREGIELDSVSNGHEAIEAIKRRDYSVLFLDIMMPRIDGWGVVDYLRLHPRSELPHVYIVTGYDQSVSTADSEIVQGLIFKPLDGEDIGSIMRQCVSGGSGREALQRTRYRWIDGSQNR